MGTKLSKFPQVIKDRVWDAKRFVIIKGEDRCQGMSVYLPIYVFSVKHGLRT